MDFDLADALWSPGSENEELDGKCSQPEEKVVPEDKICWLHKGLRVEVEYAPSGQRCLKKVAHLVIALQRMKHTPKISDSTHNSLWLERSDDPCSVIINTVFQEQIMVQVQQPVGEANTRPNAVFKRSDSLPQQCKLCDQNQKSLVANATNPESMALVAITLRGGQGQMRAKFKLSRYMSPSCSIPAQPVVVGIVGTDRYLSCSKPEGSKNPVLHLEKCLEDQLHTICPEGDKLRFLFYKKTTGISQTTFESAKYRRWFICTSVESTQPVELCLEKQLGKLSCFDVND
ncbi:hypothetical protein DPEC_G00322000 [Dallia pectoralis]|uniref:Uncharacterized protein n=1 Tax=Dallia pectoralis TaxID=75939 RepID=A0ACC2FA76_DALPE|nr:hypothetical protein DPEC_G00322000 [Dallia pectoralis]